MNRNTLRFVVMALALVLMVAMVLTGLLIRYVLPPGSGGRLGGPGLVLWDLTRHDWGAVHWWIALALLVITAVHLLLHWTWVVTLPNRWLRGSRPGSSWPSQRARWLAGVIFFAAIAALVWGWLALAGSQVTYRDSRNLDRQGQQIGSEEPRGQGQRRQHRGGSGGE